MPTLTQVTTEHRDRLMTHVDALPGLADQVGTVPWEVLAPRLRDQHGFLTSTLIPHMEAVEAGVHQELDRVLSCRLAMEPLEREHVTVRRLIAQLGDLVAREDLSGGQAIELNRVLIRLHSILKVHLREESMYVPILEHNLEPSQLDGLVASMEHAARVEL